MLLAACQQFMGKDEREVQQIAMETLEGHQRAIMGTMTVEVSVHSCVVNLMSVCVSNESIDIGVCLGQSARRQPRHAALSVSAAVR